MSRIIISTASGGYIRQHGAAGNSTESPLRHRHRLPRVALHRLQAVGGGADLGPAELVGVEQRTKAGGPPRLATDFLMNIDLALGSLVLAVGQAAKDGTVGQRRRLLTRFSSPAGAGLATRMAAQRAGVSPPWRANILRDFPARARFFGNFSTGTR